MNKFLFKFKADNEPRCLMCKHYLSCRRIRAGDCFDINHDIWIDVYSIYSDWFELLKKKAKENL